MIEGVTYQSNCGIDIAINTKGTDLHKKTDNDVNIVYFDLETTDFATDAHILQVAAKCDECAFNVYIHSEQNISVGASQATGLTKINNVLCLRGQNLQTFSIKEALTAFQEFLISLSAEKKMFVSCP